jgi:hypothetical protein
LVRFILLPWLFWHGPAQRQSGWTNAATALRAVHGGDSLERHDTVMTVRALLPALVAFGPLAGCAPSILHVSGGSQVAVPGEVPRDSKGEPVWSAIRPAPAGWSRTDARQPAPEAQGSTP